MIALLATRVLQIICTTVVLGLSISAVQWQVYGSAPATNTYNAFAGAFGLLVALIGIVAVWISAIPGSIMAIVDALSSILLLAGGIALAAGLGGASCGSSEDNLIRLVQIGLINGGIGKVQGQPQSGVTTEGQLLSHCRTAEADTVFLFFGFAAAAAAAALSFLSGRGSGGIGRHSTV